MPEGNVFLGEAAVVEVPAVVLVVGISPAGFFGRRRGHSGIVKGARLYTNQDLQGTIQ
jgi:hypothetical protein